MRRRGFVLAVMAFMLGAVSLSAPATSLAATTTAYTANNTTGASRTLPNGQFGYSDGCEVGYSGSTEFRCAFEFPLSIPSTAKILSAKLKIQKTAGCPYSTDCLVDVYAYEGNGSSDLADVTAGSLVRIYNPNGSALDMDVSADLQARVTNGISSIGYNLRRDPGNTHNPDTQDFSISGSTQVSLTVSYIAQPVDVNVYLAMTEVGAGGTVTSSPAGIDCGQACSATFEYAEPVTLTATPIAGASFVAWTHGPQECQGSNNPVCSFIVPALNLDIEATFTAPGPPPPTGPPVPTPSNVTPPPHTALPTGAPKPTAGPGPTNGPAATDVIASDGTVITPPPPTLAPGVTPGPTILGLGDDADQAGASGGIPLPIVIALILVLGGLVGGGVYWYTKRQQAS